MAKQTINLGVEANDGTGDSLRTGAFKINQNFDELYAAVGNGINSILPGEGIAVTNSFGQVTVTNSLPNRGSFNSIEVANQPTITTDQLADSLTLVAGQNVTLTTNALQKTVEISVESLDLGNLNGTFSGTFNGIVNGTVSGTFDGSVISTDIDTTLLKVSGNAAEALAYYQDLGQQKQTLLNDVNTLNNQLDSLQSDLSDAQDSLVYWQGQPASSERTTAISNLNNQILTLDAQISGVQSQIAEKTSTINGITSLMAFIQPTLDEPYASFTYDTTTLVCSTDRTLLVPALRIYDYTLPTNDGSYNQTIVTDGNGILSWSSILGDLSVTLDNNSNSITPNTPGGSIIVETYESVSNEADGPIELIYHPQSVSNSTQSTLNVGPYGVIISVDQKPINIYKQGITYDFHHTSTYPQTSTVAQLSTGVIYSSVGFEPQTLKLLVLAECNQEIQSSEIIVARNNSSVVCSVYGVVYTSASAFCEFNAQWNSIDSVIEITATNLNPTVTAYFTVQGNELSKSN